MPTTGIAVFNLRKNIRMAIDFRGLTLEELAARSEVTRPGLSNFLRGSQDSCSLDYAEKIAHGLRVPLVKLIDHSHEFAAWMQRDPK